MIRHFVIEETIEKYFFKSKNLNFEHTARYSLLFYQRYLLSFIFTQSFIIIDKQNKF